MRNVILPVLASIMLGSSPATALGVAPPVPAAPVFDDHPPAPWVTYPECDEAARRFARQHSGTTYVWDPQYVYFYYGYYDGVTEPDYGAPGCPIIE